MGDSGAISVRVIRELGGLAAIREAWRAFQAHPWGDVDYYREHLATQPDFVRPHVIVLERGGRTIGLLAGTLRRDAIPWRVGSLTLWRSRARVLRFGGGAVMGEASEATAEAITAELSAALARGEADAAYLHQIDTDSPLLSRVQRVRGLARDRASRAVGGWILDLPESYEAYLSSRSRNVRRNLKRYARLLEDELGSELEIACYREPGDLERLVRDSESVARLTYHRRMGVGFDDSRNVRHLFAHALAAGWMRGYVLYARGRAIAFWHGLVYGRTFFTRDTGYDPAFAELRPGNYLLSKIIAEHCRTRECERFDYGIMDLEYKRNFGSRRYERSSIYLFSRRPRGVWLALARTTSGAAERAARRLLGERARTLARRLGALGRSGAGEASAADAKRSDEHGAAHEPTG